MKKLFVLIIILVLASCGIEGENKKFNSDNMLLQDKININPEGDTIVERIKTPHGFIRIEVEKDSFAYFLRNLPLKPYGSKVFYYNGSIKNKDVHESVIDIDVGNRNLQQCADAVIRLRAEYLYKRGEYDKIHFNFTNGFRADYSKWMQGYRIAVNGNEVRWIKRAEYSNEYSTFRKYLDMVFAYAGTLSLSQELKPVSVEEMKIGDIFIEGGTPGHCVIIVDMAENKANGDKLFMLAQSYMPAQDIHILKNPNNKDLSPWYSTDFKGTLITPEWSFERNSLMRFQE